MTFVRGRLLAAISAFALVPFAACAADTAAADSTANASARAQPGSDIAEGSDIVVTATKANEIAPVTASLEATQPQSIVSRSFIEDSLPASADFNEIALISPSVSNYGGVNGAGLSESKAQIRGFQDGEYNVTYDGVPFGDTNDPTHHSNTFFPSNTIETLVVDRGPGNASQLGQATFGGNINMFSRTTREQPSAELKGQFGTWNTWLGRALLQSGRVDKLGGSEFLLSAQHVSSDGARTYSPFRADNIFGKALIPLGTNAKLTLLGTYNDNRFNQPDKDGATLPQVALYGKNFSLNNDPTSQTYFGYNHTHKTTDFEIGKLEWTPLAHLAITNKTYTYSYDNETLSGNDVTLYATAAPADIAKANVVTLTAGGKATTGVPGYTKTNKYRVWGDMVDLKTDIAFMTLTAGLWYEHSNTYRQQRDVDLVSGQPNYLEKKVTNPVTGALTPQNIKFDQHSNIDHLEEYAELEIRPFAGLKITPGVKHVSFERSINADYNQTTRYAQDLKNTYHATLPFLTVNYALTNSLSAYGQYARGFLMPPLSVLYVAKPSLSTVAPERSTNYQAGLVYHGQHVSLDFDGYYISFKNKFASSNAPVASDGVIWTNLGAVTYKGIEGQATYAFGSGLAIFANGSINYAKTDNAGSAHTQVPNAPVGTAAGGILFKHDDITLSLIDKYTGKQWTVDGENPGYRISGYNTAQLAAHYRVGNIRFGLSVDDLFDSTHVTNINAGKTKPFDQYFYQPGRSVSGDITVRF